MYTPDADSSLIVLVTMYGEDGVSIAARLANNYTQRISETDQDVIYGVVSRGDAFTFLPLQIVLPSEEEATAPRAQLVLHDVTHYLTPIIRELKSSPKIKLELVLSKTPDIVEVSFDDFYISSISYNVNQVTADLSMISLEREPFPAYCFTPQFNPGLF